MTWSPIHAIIIYMKKSQEFYNMDTKIIILNHFKNSSFPSHFFDIQSEMKQPNFIKSNMNISDYQTEKYCFFRFYKPISKFV